MPPILAEGGRHFLRIEKEAAVALITTEDALTSAVSAYLTGGEPFAFDTETMGEDRGNPLVTNVVWISLSNAVRSDVIPLGHPNGDLLWERFAPNAKGRARIARGIPYEDLNPKYDLAVEKERKFGDPPVQLDRATAMPILEPLFKSTSLKIAHNAKFDLHVLNKYFEGGVQGPFFDTMIASWLFDSRRVKGRMTGVGGLSLKDCVYRELGIHMEKGVGARIEDHTFDVVKKYAIIDAELTYDVYASLVGKMTPAIKWLMDLEMAVLHPVLEMEESGVLIDKTVLEDLRSEIEVEISDIETWLYKSLGRGINLRSNAQKQELLFSPKKEGGLGIRSAKLTPGGEKKRKDGEDITVHDMSTDNSVLEAYKGNPVVDKMIDHAFASKLYGTYVQPYLGGTPLSGGKYKPSQLRDGRIYGQFKQSGTESGRFSCVAGETLLPTSRGVFRFDEYIPEYGDLVRTHRGRWMPVLRKIYKGTDRMYRVRAGGNEILCTEDHRLWTPSGWSRVGDLSEGDVVVCVEVMGVALRTSGGISVQGRRQAHAGGSGGVSGDHHTERGSSSEVGSDRGGVSGREGSSVLTLEGGFSEPYAGQEWFPAPRVQGVRSRWSRVSDRAKGWWPSVPASTGDVVGAGRPGTSGVHARSSHRRGQDEQLVGQPSVGNSSGSPKASRYEVAIESITPVGTMGVWDIEVGGDHSYAAHGFLNHNSANPNLQNIPSRTARGKRIRDAFVANPGELLVVADYSQIEPRIIASLSGDPTMVAAYVAGGDVYQTVADRMDVSRSSGKTLVLAIAYGVGPTKIASDIGCSIGEARELMDYFSRSFPKIGDHKRRVLSRARSAGYSETIFGRRRYLDIKSRDESVRAMAERQAYNHLIQGSAADIMKIALVNIHWSLPEEATMLMTVHDEVVISAPYDMVEEVEAVVRTEMASARPAKIVVPLVAEVQSGYRWSDCH